MAKAIQRPSFVVAALVARGSPFGRDADPHPAPTASNCEWLALVEDATVNGAFASIAVHVERIGHLPAWYSPETDAAVHAAAAEVLAGAA